MSVYMTRYDALELARRELRNLWEVTDLDSSADRYKQAIRVLDEMITEAAGGSWSKEG